MRSRRHWRTRHCSAGLLPGILGCTIGTLAAHLIAACEDTWAGRLAAACAGWSRVARMTAGQAWHMDIRVKTFLQEAASGLAFLRAEYGF